MASLGIAAWVTVPGMGTTNLLPCVRSTGRLPVDSAVDVEVDEARRTGLAIAAFPIGIGFDAAVTGVATEDGCAFVVFCFDADASFCADFDFAE